MFGGILFEELKQMMRLTGFGTEVDVGEEYRADLFGSHDRIDSRVTTGLGAIKPEQLSDAIVVFSMQAAWHGNISRALPKYYEIVNLAAPVETQTSPISLLFSNHQINLAQLKFL
jgi:hypothetical protein